MFVADVVAVVVMLLLVTVFVGGGDDGSITIAALVVVIAVVVIKPHCVCSLPCQFSYFTELNNMERTWKIPVSASRTVLKGSHYVLTSALLHR